MADLISIATLLLTAATLVLVAYDIVRRYRPILRVRIRPRNQSSRGQEEITVENIGGPTTLTQIKICTFDTGSGYTDNIIWAGQQLIEQHRPFTTHFVLSAPERGRAENSYFVELKHSAGITERRFTKS